MTMVRHVSNDIWRRGFDFFEAHSKMHDNGQVCFKRHLAPGSFAHDKFGRVQSLSVANAHIFERIGFPKFGCGFELLTFGADAFCL